jgi:ubiquitin-conjugating enzyme E2 O
MKPCNGSTRPGDHVLWKNEEGSRAAIVQSVNATDRTALILLGDSRTLETVSVLELDPHGAYEQNGPAAQSVTDGFGVHRSDFVFIHPEGSVNGFETPYVPRIGELENWVHETPIYDCHPTGWRKEMSELGNSIAEQRNSQSPVDKSMRIPCPGDGCLQWIGEVTEVGGPVLHQFNII